MADSMIARIPWESAVLFLADDPALDHLRKDQSDEALKDMQEQAHATILLKVRHHLVLDPAPPASFIFWFTAWRWRTWLENHLYRYQNYYGGSVPTPAQLAATWCKLVQEQWTTDAPYWHLTNEATNGND